MRFFNDLFKYNYTLKRTSKSLSILVKNKRILSKEDIPVSSYPIESYESSPNFWIINRIGNESRRPRYFNETLPFSSMAPYRLTERNVFSDDDVPLHCSSSLEIVLYENVSGNVVVDNRHLYIENNTVVISPPMAVHGNWVTGTSGKIYCLQISIESMTHYIQIDIFLAEKGLSLQNVPMTIPEYDRLRELFDELFAYDQNVFRRNIAVLSIIEVLASHIPCADECVEQINASKEELKMLITWTHSSFAQKITLDDAAAVVNFSKHYFCKWFKKNTGMNYIQYLKRVRVYNASMLLLSGKTVSEAGYASGFENMSNFIKCFKEIRGCTPKNFVEGVRAHNE